MDNPYKDYYDAKSSGDECRAAEVKERIENLEEMASLNGISVETLLNSESFNAGY